MGDLDAFSPGALARLRELSERYPTGMAAVMPALHVAQEDFGWLGPEALRAVAEYLGLPEMAVRSTATFYSMYRHKKMGRNIIRLCTNVSCMLVGAVTLKGALEDRYGLVPGGASPDGRFSLEIAGCIGACGSGPAMLVNDDLHTGLNAKNIIELLESCK